MVFPLATTGLETVPHVLAVVLTDLSDEAPFVNTVPFPLSFSQASRLSTRKCASAAEDSVEWTWVRRDETSSHIASPIYCPPNACYRVDDVRSD